jgi:hypothetical protein
VIQGLNRADAQYWMRSFETREAVRAAARSPKPVYLRFGKKKMANLPRLDSSFELGKASLIREGSDLSYLACGETVAPAVAAAELLAEDGVQWPPPARVLARRCFAPPRRHRALGDRCSGSRIGLAFPDPFREKSLDRQVRAA